MQVDKKDSLTEPWRKQSSWMIPQNTRFKYVTSKEGELVLVISLKQKKKTKLDFCTCLSILGYCRDKVDNIRASRRGTHLNTKQKHC